MNQGTGSPQISVIVPLYNEEENVPILQSELRTALNGVDHEIIFVDDGSADHTVERIEAAPNIHVIRFQMLQRGLKRLLDLGREAGLRIIGHAVIVAIGGSEFGLNKKRIARDTGGSQRLQCFTH